MSLQQPLSDAQILSLPLLNGRRRLYRLSDGYALRMPALDQAEAQAIHVSIRPEEFIKDESGDIEGTISDSVYLGLNTGISSKQVCLKNSG